MTGALLAQATGQADTTVLAAFAVGFVSFVSPCVLPLVPGYLSAVSGVAIADMRSGERDTRAVLVPAAIFCASFTLMFVALGMTATGLGNSLLDNRETLNRAAGAFIMAMGVLFVATPFVPRLNRDWRPEALIARAGSGGPVIAGLAFAVAWTPCVGPTLTAILGTAAASDTVGKGGLLLACYSAGLAIPFLVTALAFDRATTAWRWLRDRYVIITAVSGLVLVAMGYLMLTDQLTTLNQDAQELLEAVGLDALYEF